MVAEKLSVLIIYNKFMLRLFIENMRVNMLNESSVNF